MNFYPHHLGDYAKDTGHLSVTEHGAYRLLMDHYYSTEKPLPEDFHALYRVCRATSHIEKTAVKSVVAKFFPLENGIRTHKRIEHELSLYRERVETNKSNGMKGGRPPKEKPAGLSAGCLQETQTKPKNNPIQNPEANNQDPILNPSEGRTDPLSNLRPTLEQARQGASELMITPKEGEDWWLAREASGWMKGSGGGGTTPVGSNWRADLQRFTNGMKESRAADKAKNGKSKGPTNCLAR